MRPNKYSTLLFTAMLALAMITGCSEKSQPVSGTTDDAALSSAATSVITQIANNYPGIDLTNTKGIVSLNWRKMLRPETQTADTRGDAMVVGFDSVIQSGTRPRPGKDIGTVSLAYGSSSLQLEKIRERGRGVSYSTHGQDPRIDSGTNVSFVANGQYQFDVSGSTAFTAMNVSITAPSALIHITAPAVGDSVNTSGDLTITWSGGSAGGNVLLNIAAVPARGMMGDSLHRPPSGDSLGHRGPGGPGGPGGPHGPGGGGMGHDGPPQGGPPPGGPPSGGMGPGQGGPRGDSTRVIVVKLGTNPGTYTITAAQLQGIVQEWAGAKIVVNISQVSVTDVDHDGGKVHLLLGNDDVVVVNTKGTVSAH